MAIPDSKRLRQLVSDYYHGLVTSDSYREQRAFLLDNIGKHVEPEQDMTAPRPQTRATVAKADIPVRPASDDESASSGSKTAIIGVVVVAIVLVGAYLVLDPFAGPDSTPGESDVAAEGGGPGPGDVLIEEFLAQNDWRQDSLGNFALAWEAMEAPQRNEATGGRQYRRLTTVLHRRIREHLALDGSADNNELASLMELAATIGAPYERAQTPVPGPRDPVQSVGDEAETVEDAPVVTAEPAVTEEPGKMREAEQAKPANVESDVRAEAENEDFSPVVEEEMSAGESESIEIDDPCPADLASTRRPYCRDVIQSGGTGPDMVVLPMGSFGMGSDVSAEESPAHNVDIAYHIAVSAYEITAGEFAKFCTGTGVACPDSVADADAPVVSVSWNDATAYVEWLSASTGFTYRLPSEAEWEYAARAGTDTPYFFGDEITPSAAHSAENGTFDSPVSKGDRIVNRNNFRLYHMSGNVREWVRDAWYPGHNGAPGDGSARVNADEERRVVRGGSYKDPASKLRSAARESLPRTHRDEVTGFRVVREIRQ